MRPDQDLRRIPAASFAPVPDRLVQHAGQARCFGFSDAGILRQPAILKRSEMIITLDRDRTHHKKTARFAPGGRISSGLNQKMAYKASSATGSDGLAVETDTLPVINT